MRPSRVSRKVPDAWLRCTVCLGTGYAFSPSTSVIKANMSGAVGTMTNRRCEACKGSGFVPHLDC
jgi:hypothetical protein